MRRIARLERSIDLVAARASVQSSSAYLCSACRRQATPFSTSAIRAAKVPYTEKIRQKIWGTENPPGQVDPYGQASVFDQKKKRQEEEEMEEQRGKATEAAQIEAAQPDMSTYEPATTWDGIPKVGGFGGWWKENWDPDHRYNGFMPRTVMDAPEQIIAAVHRALVEVYACKQAGLPRNNFERAIRQDITGAIQIRPGATGVELQFPEGVTFDVFAQFLQASVDETAVHEAPTESEEDITADRSLEDPLHPESTEAPVEETSTKENPTESEEDVAADRSPVDPLRKAIHKASRKINYEKLVKSWDPSWRQVPLEDPEIKFAVLKRVTQLTGIRIPDSALQSSKTVGAFLSHLVKPPKPRKLAEAIKQQRHLSNLKNVNVYSRRITPIDKEKQVGRWKLIEKELKQRGLPVTGH